MAAQIQWDQVFVRHVVAAKRSDIGRIHSLLRTPFYNRSSCCSDAGAAEVRVHGVPEGRWMLALRFAGETWVPLFSNAATGAQLFEANAASRRMEVVWIGRDATIGRFFRLHRAGAPITQFAQENHADDAAQQIVERLCGESDIPFGRRRIAWEQELRILAADGNPVELAVSGYIAFSGPEVEAEDDPESDALFDLVEKLILRESPRHMEDEP